MLGCTPQASRPINARRIAAHYTRSSAVEAYGSRGSVTGGSDVRIKDADGTAHSAQASAQANGQGAIWGIANTKKTLPLVILFILSFQYAVSRADEQALLSNRKAPKGAFLAVIKQTRLTASRGRL
ncbi:hypothetical protein GX441_11370 [bacterium]|nr:hypothetical protein [bacterium]